MFEYIGRKIKVLAKVMFWLGIIGWSLYGVIAIIVYASESDATNAVASLIIMLIALIASTVSSWLVYGLGQVIDNSDKLVSLKQEEINQKAVPDNTDKSGNIN